jgi:acetyltransferase-like isoleucine patch superfamily enzyme
MTANIAGISAYNAYVVVPTWGLLFALNILQGRHLWTRFWMHFAGLSLFGRIATRLATWFAPPYKARCYLAHLNSKGYISPDAIINHDDLQRGRNVFIGDRVVIHKAKDGGQVELADCVHLYGDIIIETGEGGSVTIGPKTHIQPRCQLSAYKESIKIGSRVEIAPNCAFYPYNHGFAAGLPIREQLLKTDGGIVIDDDVWLGTGVIVLDGVRIGRGAVIGAGAVVTRDVPAGAIAVGVPAAVVRMRPKLTANVVEEE